MSVRTRRLAIAAVFAPAAIALPVAALAASSGSAPTKPAPSSTSESAAAGSKSAAAASKSAAAGPASCGDRSLTGLAASKCAAAASKSAPVPAVLRTFASRLGVSPSAAGRVLKQLAALNAKVGGVDPTGSAFAAIADGLEVSPARLAAAWNAVLHSVAGN